MRYIQTDGMPITAAAPASRPRTRRRVMFMARLAPKWRFWQGGWTFLDFSGVGGLNRRNQSERRSFRPAARPLRPEANARQRDAPSGAKVFGISSRRSARR